MSVESPFKANILQGRRALVTGGGSGIGFAIAQELGRHGAHVVIMGRRVAALESSLDTLKADGIQGAVVAGDVRQVADAERAVATAAGPGGKLDILVNCAAGNFIAPIDALSQKGFKTVMEIDALGTFTMSHAALPALKASGDALVINVSAKFDRPPWYQAHAAAAKMAVDSLTRSCALEWGEYGIRAVGVAPGPIRDTPGMAKLSLGKAKKGDAPDADPMMRWMVPLGRTGTPLEIALTCVFLASSAASYISGDVIVVDGGSWLTGRPPSMSRDQVTAVSRQVEAQSRRSKL